VTDYANKSSASSDAAKKKKNDKTDSSPKIKADAKETTSE
jgi:hypothetical protein